MNLEKTENLRRRKAGDPIVCLTAYTASIARIVDAHADLILVGDSLAMVVYGMETTVGVSLDTMIMHGRAVSKSAENAVVIVDLPAGSYETDAAQALASAQRVVAETGCDGIKLEGGVDMAPQIRAIVDAGIPVMGHVGLMPQSVEKIGGYKIQGKSVEDAARMLTDAQAVEEAGVFSVVIECTMEAVAADISQKISIPTIGIGGSAACDGQILVTDDMLGLTSGALPRFVKKYADLDNVIDEAVAHYAHEVRKHKFPGPQHLYFPKAD